MFSWLLNLLSIMQTSMDYNMTNFTLGGIIRYGFDPYYSIFGNFTWGIIFGFIGAGIYANERSLGTIMIYLMLVGVFFGIVFPSALIFIFGLLFTFMLTNLLYQTFVKKR